MSIHRPDFRRALVGLPISLVVLGVLSLVVLEKKPERTHAKPSFEQGGKTK